MTNGRMLRKSIAGFLAVSTCLFVYCSLCLISISAQTPVIFQPHPGVDLSSPSYSRLGGNPFDDGSGEFQCTRFAWGRASQKLGVNIRFSATSGRDGGQWLRLTVGLTQGSSPRPNSIAVWSGGPHGHVAFVEDVDGDQIKITEANFASYPAARYDGVRTLTSAQMQHRGKNNEYTLVGYIYLTGFEGFVDYADCFAISGWGADRSWLWNSVFVDIYEGERQFVGSVYANAIRVDVGNYLADNGFHGFSFPIPDWLKDGREHVFWARFSGSNTDLINSKKSVCGSASQNGNLLLTFSSNSVRNIPGAPCSPTYEFTLSGKETSGIGLNLSTLTLSEGWSWNLPILGIPSRLNPYEEFRTTLNWCRGPGQSTWTISGTDDRGNQRTWSAGILFILQ